MKGPQPRQTEPAANHQRDLVERVLTLLGLARRAGRLAIGGTAVEKLVRNGARPVVVLARDAGGSQRQRCARWQPLRGVISGLVTRADLSRQFGRDDLVVVAVADPGIVHGLLQLGVVDDPQEQAGTLR